MRKKLLLSVAVSLLFLTSASAQKMCDDIPGQTSASYRFRRLGEAIEIPLRNNDDDCEPVAIDLHWSNGRNNGSNFNVTFLDARNRPVYARQISAFMSGVLQLPLSSMESQAVYGSSMALISVPTTIRIQTVSPFAGSALLSYSIERIAVRRKERTGEEGKGERESTGSSQNGKEGNEVVSIRDTVRLIGSTRLPLVQIELKTNRPFPVKDVPLQLQIGKKVFLDELSGDYTGRKLTLSLTPEMFAALNDGDEIVAFYGKTSANESSGVDVWHFGKLQKSRKKS
jgi:hypothetical protein